VGLLGVVVTSFYQVKQQQQQQQPCSVTGVRGRRCGWAPCNVRWT
jgi:hypothetical protein